MTPPPKLHHPLTNHKAVVLESPYVAAIEHYIENMNCKPSTFYNKERHGIINRLIEVTIIHILKSIF